MLAESDDVFRGFCHNVRILGLFSDLHWSDLNSDEFKQRLQAFYDRNSYTSSPFAYNEHLWSTAEGRAFIHQTLTIDEKPYFEFWESRRRESHPEWFLDVPEKDPDEQQGYGFENVREDLLAIYQRQFALESRLRTLRAWLFLIVACALVLLFLGLNAMT